MRHLNYKKRDSLAFIDDIISSLRKRKTDTEQSKYKDRCQLLRNTNEDYLLSYDTAFDNDDFNEVVGTHPALSNAEASDMLGLYDYNKPQIHSLKDDVLTDDGYENPYCPICEANIAGTMDHYLPKSDFHLLSIHPKNLIPCCSDCNGHKNDSKILKDGKRVFWNAYLDNPPEKSYIVCSIFMDDNGLPKAQFALEQSDIEDEVYDKIEATIVASKVLTTYQKVANKEINDISKKIRSRVAALNCSVEEATKSVLALAKETISDPYGWKSVLLEALSQSKDYVDFNIREIQKNY